MSLVTFHTTWLVATNQSEVISELSTQWFSHQEHTHTHPFNGPFSGTTQQVSWYQKGKINPDFTEKRQ